MKSQREATVNAILSVLEERGVSYELNGTTVLSDILTSEDKKKVQSILSTGFVNGDIQMSSEAKDKYIGNTSEMNKYVSGLINNWVRKFPAFNNGSKYEIKNKGSRTGSQDEQVREMKKLLSATTDVKAKELIQAAITSRLAEIKPEKKVEVNLDSIPAELREALGL